MTEEIFRTHINVIKRFAKFRTPFNKRSPISHHRLLCHLLLTTLPVPNPLRVRLFFITHSFLSGCQRNKNTYFSMKIIEE